MGKKHKKLNKKSKQKVKVINKIEWPQIPMEKAKPEKTSGAGRSFFDFLTSLSGFIKSLFVILFFYLGKM